MDISINMFVENMVIRRSWNPTETRHGDLLTFHQGTLTGMELPFVIFLKSLWGWFLLKMMVEKKIDHLQSRWSKRTFFHSQI